MTSSEAESGPVQGAAVSGWLVEPTNSASTNSILFVSRSSQEMFHSIKEKTRNENCKGEWPFLTLLPMPQVPCLTALYTSRTGAVKEKTFQLFHGGECPCRYYRPKLFSSPALPSFSSKSDKAEEQPWRRGGRDSPSRAGGRRRCRKCLSRARAPRQSLRTPPQG